MGNIRYIFFRICTLQPIYPIISFPIQQQGISFSNWHHIKLQTTMSNPNIDLLQHQNNCIWTRRFWSKSFSLRPQMVRTPQHARDIIHFPHIYLYSLQFSKSKLDSNPDTLKETKLHTRFATFHSIHSHLFSCPTDTTVKLTWTSFRIRSHCLTQLLWKIIVQICSKINARK